MPCRAPAIQTKDLLAAATAEGGAAQEAEGGPLAALNAFGIVLGGGLAGYVYLLSGSKKVRCGARGSVTGPGRAGPVVVSVQTAKARVGGWGGGFGAWPACCLWLWVASRQHGSWQRSALQGCR